MEGSRPERRSVGAQPDGAGQLEGWVHELQLSRFFPALIEQGVDSIAFVQSMDEADAAELCDEVGMRRMQKKRFLKAVRKLRSVPPAPPKTASLAQAVSEEARSNGEEMLFDIGSSSGDDDDSRKEGAEFEQAKDERREEQEAAGNSSASSVPVRVWLDVVQPGFGAKFSSAFEAAGLDVLEDLAGTDKGEIAELEAELVRVGAKRAHLRKIRAAIQRQSRASNTQGRTPQPSLRGHENRSGKRFAAFLSHHKVAAAMDARFVKDKLEQMLGAEVFLDSDNLQDLRLLLDHVRQSDVLVLFQACARACRAPTRASVQPPNRSHYWYPPHAPCPSPPSSRAALVTRRPARCCSGRTASWRSTPR